MTKTIELIEKLKDQSIELSLAGENLLYKGPSIALGAETIAEIERHKPDLMAYLRLQSVEHIIIEKKGAGDFTQIYRPCRISEVVGNESAKKIIARVFNDNRIPQSFLFHGLSGTGKTTMARIIEMGLNCQQGPTCEPCCKCAYCRSIIDRRGNLAVREINAVEKLKDELLTILQEIDAYGFGGIIEGNRKSVFLVDECHGLTQEQAQLFLKYVEDAHEDNYFIFCTTAFEKVLPTLRDRCIFQIEFSRVPVREILRLLRGICLQEQIEPDEEVLRKIAEEASGKPRVAVNKLQQSYYAGNLKRRTMQE
jgi:DNA polymerase-3 subunit gamma/tau